MASSSTTSMAPSTKSLLAEWILQEDRNPIESAVFAAVDHAEKSVGVPFDLTKKVVDYLQRYDCFGESEWNSLCGSVPPEPPLPLGFARIWQSPCPAFLGKKICETHVLFYIPTTVDGKPLTLKSLGQIAKRYFPKTAAGYRDVWPDIVDELGDRPIERSGWVLMTKYILPESRSKSYADRNAMVAALAEKAFAPYEVPKALEAIVCILAQYFSSYASSKIRLFSDAPLTYIHCQENVRACQISVGGFAPVGLSAKYCPDYGHGDIGVAALRWFEG